LNSLSASLFYRNVTVNVRLSLAVARPGHHAAAADHRIVIGPSRRDRVSDWHPGRARLLVTVTVPVTGDRHGHGPSHGPGPAGPRAGRRDRDWWTVIPYDTQAVTDSGLGGSVTSSLSLRLCPPAAPGRARAATRCHGDDLRVPGPANTTRMIGPQGHGWVGARGVNLRVRPVPFLAGPGPVASESDWQPGCPAGAALAAGFFVPV
jgi:hypothetical protein